MHKLPQSGTGPTVVLNVEKLNQLRRAHEIKSDVELARMIGVDTATLFRVTSGRTAPSNVFIARLSLAFPAVPLDSLFEVRRSPEQVAS